MVTPEKWDKLRAWMAGLDIAEQDIDEHFIRGSGHGGQKINKTASCVQLVYRPEAVEVRCQKTRSQADNRYWARRELCERMDRKKRGAASERQQAAAKIRRQKRRRSRRAKAKMLDEKNRQGEKKRLRRRVRPEE